MKFLPPHLQKYVVDQDYEKYTARDQAVWRFVLRQLKSFLSSNAHSSYLEGLEKTGIEIEQIPRIENISAQLEKFGWKALPVSGFIPPAAFMELQSLSILPIASDMRSIEHLEYTPAPDIVHEAAGHAPIIADLEYATYLKQYAQIAKKAIISKEDLDLYKAIRELSDIKENPSSTKNEISASEENLSKISKSMTFVSEAAELSRMNWWTAEYGLIGDLKNPQIFGAGLLSSVGESRSSLSDRVRKIPLSLDCIRQTYDITEPQPQLFVAKDFKHLSTVLEELAKTMAYRIGGTKALERAKAAASINTVELNNKIQISGVLKNFILNSEGLPIYLQFEGPTQLGFNNKEVTGHGTSYHQQGYGTPIGEIIRPQFSDFKIGEITEVVFRSGVTISGILSKIVTLGDGAAILSFENATCKNKNEILFLPDWGTFDIVTGISVSAAFGGPADRLAYGDFEDFIASKIVRPIHSEEQKRLFTYYQDVRNLRNSQQFSEEKLNELFHRFLDNAPTEWLLFLELSEMALKAGISPKNYEAQLSKLNPKDLISEGLKLAYAKY